MSNSTPKRKNRFTWALGTVSVFISQLLGGREALANLPERSAMELLNPTLPSTVSLFNNLPPPLIIEPAQKKQVQFAHRSHSSHSSHRSHSSHYSSHSGGGYVAPSYPSTNLQAPAVVAPRYVPPNYVVPTEPPAVVPTKPPAINDGKFTVRLTDGSVLRGKVSMSGEEVIVTTAFGNVKIPKNNILAIER